MARQLLVQDFVILDGFLPDDLTSGIKEELQSIYRAGEMKQGLLAGGRTGTNIKYSMENVRGTLSKHFDRVLFICFTLNSIIFFVGDYVVWVDGLKRSQKHIHTYLQRVDTCVSEMSRFIPELKSITNRSEAMCTCYPGEGARYTRHCDNPNQNGRKLTALLYLNEDWKQTSAT